MNNSSQSSKLKISPLISVLLNILTIFMLVAFLGVVCFFSAVFINPYSALNPFPPPTKSATFAMPTDTPQSLIVLPPTWTATPTLEPSATNTPAPLPPSTFTPTPFLFSPTPSLTFTVPPEGYPYEVRQDSPQAISNIYHPELDCQWMGVGGQVVDLNESPVTGLIIRLGGSLPGIGILEPLISLTGVALNYGRGGYEFTLADRPIASQGTLWVQLVDETGLPLSHQIYFDTFNSCDLNLILIDFIRVR
jgi:hypothetical protein